MQVSKLYDRNNIILNINNNLINRNNCEDNIFKFFENYILTDNIILNYGLINYYFYKNSLTTTIIDNIQENIKNNLIQYVKSQRKFYRNKLKTCIINIENVNEFIEKYYKKIKYINTTLHNFNFSIDNIEKKGTNLKKWGNSPIINTAIEVLCNNLLCDNTILKILEHSIINDINIYKFISFLKIFYHYNDNSEPNQLLDYVSYKNKIDNILKNIFKNNLCENEKFFNMFDSTLNKIYIFKETIKYLKYINKNYYYVVFDKNFNMDYTFSECFNLIINSLEDICKTLSFNNLVTFLNTYIKEIKYIKFISKNKDIERILLDTSISKKSLMDFINYTSIIYEIFNYNSYPLDNFINYYNTNIFKSFALSDIKSLMKVINKNILNNEISKNEFIYKFLGERKNLDEILKYLEINLIKRIIYFNSAYNTELRNFNMLTTYIKDSFNMQIILNDYAKSKTFIADEFYQPNKLQVYITTPEIWSINIDSGYLNLKNLCIKDNIFTEYIFSVDSGYKAHNINKYLLFHSHIGKVDINFNSDYKKINIIMLPIQMIFFEMFENINSKDIDYCHKILESYLENYLDKDNDIIDNVTNSFIRTNLILIKDNFYVLNTKYNENDFINLIEVYNDIANTEVIIDKRIKEELAHSNDIIISTNINHYLKHNSNVVKNDIFNYCKENLPKINITLEIIDKVINNMIEKDYIKNQDNTYFKLVY